MTYAAALLEFVWWKFLAFVATGNVVYLVFRHFNLPTLEPPPAAQEFVRHLVSSQHSVPDDEREGFNESTI